MGEREIQAAMVATRGAYIERGQVLLDTTMWITERTLSPAPEWVAMLQGSLDAWMVNKVYREWDHLGVWLSSRTAGGSWLRWADVQEVTLPIQAHEGHASWVHLDTELMIFPFVDIEYGAGVVTLPMAHGKAAGAPTVWAGDERRELCDWYSYDMWDGTCTGSPEHAFTVEAGDVKDLIINDGTEARADISPRFEEYEDLFDHEGTVTVVCPADGCGAPVDPYSHAV